MAPMGKFIKKLNCHNSGCTQDRVVIFGFRVGFSGTAYLTASSKFTPDDHRCHGNEIWDKNGYNSAYIRAMRRSLRITGGFRGGLLNDASQILPRPTPVAMATKFWTKSALTRFV